MQTKNKLLLTIILAGVSILCAATAKAMPSPNAILSSINPQNQYNLSNLDNPDSITPEQLKQTIQAVTAALDTYQAHIDSNNLTPQDKQIHTMLQYSFPEVLNNLPNRQTEYVVVELASISYDLAVLLLQEQTIYAQESIRIDAAANIVMLLGVNLSLTNPLLTEEAKQIILNGFSKQLQESLIQNMLSAK